MKKQINTSMGETMSEKLSELCIEYCKYIKCFNEIDDKIRRKILEIVKEYDSFVKSIEYYSFVAENNTLKVVYKYSFQGYEDRNEYAIPVQRLDLNKTEIRKIIKAEIKEEKKKRIEAERKEVERKEREEYERLKVKYGKEQ